MFAQAAAVRNLGLDSAVTRNPECNYAPPLGLPLKQTFAGTAAATSASKRRPPASAGPTRGPRSTRAASGGRALDEHGRDACLDQDRDGYVIDDYVPNTVRDDEDRTRTRAASVTACSGGVVYAIPVEEEDTVSGGGGSGGGIHRSSETRNQSVYEGFGADAEEDNTISDV